MAVSTLPIFAIIFLPVLFMMPHADKAGNPIDFPFKMFLFMPIFYLIFTYLFVAFSCLVYNLLFRLIGGFEFEFNEEDQPVPPLNP